jgi:acyl-CoA synthetase (AMP-forming)/AMP-acid ligase II
MNGLELLHRIEQHGREAPQRIAYVEAASGRTLTYARLIDRVQALRGSMGPGAVAMLRCSNRIEYPIWFLATLGAGASVFPVSVELAHAELKQLARRAAVGAIVADGETLEALRDDIALSLPIDRALHHNESPPAQPASPGDLLLASSGTTGEPKIVRRSAAAIDAVSRNMVEAIGFTRDDRVLASVPLTHSYGLEHGLLAPLWAGSSVRLCDGLDLPVITRALADDISVFPAVPSMFEMLADVADPVAPNLRLAYSAGAPLPSAVAHRFEQRFGVRVGQLYGMSEIGSVTFNHPARDPFDPRSAGRPMRDVSIRILEPDGQVVVRAPSMLSGYIGDDVALIDGHFPTGDLGHLDGQGDLTLTGRARLLIDTGGMKVNPIEVESVLAAHPDVVECVIVPVKQSQTVQRLCALIVPRDHRSPPSIESIRSFAKEKLAAYKVPRMIEIRTSLPRTATGKVIRHLLESPP